MVILRFFGLVKQSIETFLLKFVWFTLSSYDFVFFPHLSLYHLRSFEKNTNNRANHCQKQTSFFFFYLFVFGTHSFVRMSSLLRNKPPLICGLWASNAIFYVGLSTNRFGLLKYQISMFRLCFRFFAAQCHIQLLDIEHLTSAKFEANAETFDMFLSFATFRYLPKQLCFESDEKSTQRILLQNLFTFRLKWIVFDFLF